MYSQQTITSTGIQRKYCKWRSHFLGIDMELLIFGFAGKPVLFFPTRTARFFDYEDWNVIEALQPQLIAGELQIFCVDSVDKLSFYNKAINPSERIQQHELFEKYILQEVLPFIKETNNNNYLVAAGCSLGAYHAVNIAFRHPQLFKKIVGMSGRYDLTIRLKYFDNLLDGFMNEVVFNHMPTLYLPLIQSPQSLRLLKKLDIVIAIGEEDHFLENNQLLHQLLIEKTIEHKYIVWPGEAHKAMYWSKMVALYF